MKPLKRKRINKIKILLDFLKGISMLGLARKYGRTVKQIEQIIREVIE
jgi:hypothetical protein